jgi:transposase
MDEHLPLGSPDAATLVGLLEKDRVQRRALEQEVVRLQAGLKRQNERILELEELLAAAVERGQQQEALSAGLQEQNALLRQQIAVLTAEVAARPRKREPGAWPSERTKGEGEPKERTRRDRRHNHGRQRSSQVDEWVEHAVESCPSCGTSLSGGWVHRRIQVIELPESCRAQVTEHVLLRRDCPSCRRRVLPPVPGRAHGRLGRTRFGPRLLAAVATMASVERLPLRQIRARLEREYGLVISQGGVVGLLRQVATQGTPAVDHLRIAIRGSPVVHADETGWREDGIPGYVWTVSTATACLFHRAGSRAGTVIDEVLSEDFGGVLVTDFYAAYDHLLGAKQRCWAHTWRDISALEHEFPEDTDLAAWVAGVRAIYDLATAQRPSGEEGMTPQAVRARACRAAGYEQQLLLLCPETLSSDRPEATLAKRFRRYSTELFTFVRELAVPPTNNAAERSLRPVVIARKVSGGTRSAAGSTVRMTLASLAATARLRGDNPTDVFLAVLTAPQPSPSHPHTL